jgi:hypothetical protein
VRNDYVVFQSPVFDRNRILCQRIEDLPVEIFLSGFSIEALNVPILERAG